MITFYSVSRPFSGEFDDLQRMAIESWDSAVDGAQIVLMGDETGVADVCKEYGWQHARTLPLNRHGTPLVSGAFYLAEILAEHSLLCKISADIMIGDDFAQALEAIAEIERPFVVGQRWDIEPGTPADSARLHHSSGADYFIYRKGTLGEIPPFAIGRTMYDNWLLWAAMDWGLQLIDATKDITAYHLNHSYPQWQQHDEREENHRLAWATGMDRIHGIHDAPWSLIDGRVQRKELA
jgi:hypothetical protein